MIGVLFVTDVHNHADPANFEAAARAFWPAKPPRIDRFTLSSWAERVRIPVGQVSPAIAEILVRGDWAPARGLVESRRNGARLPIHPRSTASRSR